MYTAHTTKIGGVNYMLKLIVDTIVKHKMITTGDSVVIGLSGGADSVMLLHVLRQLKNELGISEIFAVHVNHNLRGNDAKEDENFARWLSRHLEVKIEVFQANVREIAEKDGIGIEEAGRNARYLFLNEALQVLNASKIALGHNRDDVAETVIMNLCRGAGLKGLGGIPPVNGNVIRPLINLPRSEIESYVAINKLQHITDISNFSPEYTRNRVRNTVLPLIEKSVNPQVKAIIARNAAWLRDDDEFLENIAMEAQKNCLNKNKIDIEKLSALPPAISRRVIRQAIAAAHNLQNIASSHIQAVIDLAHGETGKEIHIPGLVIKKEYSHLILQKNTPKPKGYCYEIKLNTPLHIPETNKIFTLTKTKPEETNPPGSKMPILYCTKAFECDIVTGLLKLRTRQKGDKIALKGFSQKLQDYFVNTKTPRHERDTIPLVTINNDIICILDPKGRTSTRYFVKNQNQEPISEKIYWATLWSDE